MLPPLCGMWEKRKNWHMHIKRQLLNNCIQLLHELIIMSTNFYSHVAAATKTWTCSRGSLFTGYKTFFYLKLSLQLNILLTKGKTETPHTSVPLTFSSFFSSPDKLPYRVNSPRSPQEQYSLRYVAMQIVLILSALSLNYHFLNVHLHCSTMVAKDILSLHTQIYIYFTFSILFSSIVSGLWKKSQWWKFPKLSFIGETFFFNFFLGEPNLWT